MKKKPFAKSRPPKPAAKRSAEVPPPPDRLLAPEFLQERPSEQETLLALERLLTRAEGFALAFARVNMPTQRVELVQEIRRRLEPRGFVIIEVDFREPVADLLWELESRLERFDGIKQKAGPRARAVAEAGPRFAIFVYGLENSITSAAVYHPLLAVMNYKRENFREQIPGPLVLWVPEYVLQAVIEGAPDFWAWRSGVFEFAAPQEQLEKMRGQFERERGSRALARLPVEEKKNRIQLFANLLAEYEARDDANAREIAAIRADLLNRLGLLHDHLGNLNEALECYERSLALRREISDRAGEGTTLNNISQIYDARGDYGKALEYLEKSLAIQREIGDRAGEGTTLNNLATTAYAGGDYGKALEYLEKSLAIRREIGDRAGEGRTLNNISQIYDARGDYDQALAYLEKSLAITREIGDRAGEGRSLHNIAHIHWQNQAIEAAVANFIEALKLARETNAADLLFAVSRDLGDLLCQLGQKEHGLPLLEQALAVGRQMGTPGVARVEALLRQYR